MAAEGEVYLYPEGVESDAVLISTFAREIVKDYERFGSSDRTLTGDLKRDTTAKKYTFTINYEHIDQATLDLIYAESDPDQRLQLKMYITNSTWFTNFDGNIPVVVMDPFSYTDFRCGFETKIYKNLSLTFIEV